MTYADRERCPVLSTQSLNVKSFHDVDNDEERPDCLVRQDSAGVLEKPLPDLPVRPRVVWRNGCVYEQGDRDARLEGAWGKLERCDLWCF